MRFFFSVFIYLMVSSSTIAQDLPKIDTTITKVFSLEKYYGHAVAITEEYLMLIGGRIQVNDENENLHFEDEPNENIILIDWNSRQTILAPIRSMGDPFAESLSSTAFEYYQDDGLLYIIGGYGYNSECNCYTTQPSMIILEVDKTIDALLEGQNPRSFMRLLKDDRLAVMEGFLEKAEDTFFLLEGKQAYKLSSEEDNSFYYVESFDNQVRSFKIKDDGIRLELNEFKVWSDLDAFFDHFSDLIKGTYLGTGEYRFKKHLPF